MSKTNNLQLVEIPLCITWPDPVQCPNKVDLHITPLHPAISNEELPYLSATYRRPEVQKK